MCLENNEGEVVKGIREGPPQDIVAYKVLLRSEDQLTGPFYNHSYQPGINRSDREAKVNYHSVTVVHGIHAYLEEADARRMMYNFNHTKTYIVKVVGKSQHLLGMNENQVCFEEVTLSQEEYERTLA